MKCILYEIHSTVHLKHLRDVLDTIVLKFSISKTEHVQTSIPRVEIMIPWNDILQFRNIWIVDTE